MFIFNSPENKTNLEIVLGKFDIYYEPRKKLTNISHKFFMCKQVEDKKFVTKLCHKAQECELGDIANSLIQDILICSIKDSKLRKHLLMQLALTLSSLDCFV